jgi:hypothetical protein
MNILLFLSLSVASCNLSSAAVLTVSSNSFDDLETKLGQANDKDTIIIPAGKYIGKDVNGNWPSTFNGNNAGHKNICNMVSNNVNSLIIKGIGSKPIKVKLIGIMMQYCDFFLVVENLSMFFCDDHRAIIEHDNDKGLVMRDVVINTPYASQDGINIMSHRVAIIDSEIKTYPALPGVGMSGLTVEGAVTILNSDIKGYKYGIMVNNLTPNSDPKEWKIYNNKLNKNTVDCVYASNTAQTCDFALSSINPNTPASGTPYFVSQFIDILRYDNWPPVTAGPYIPVVVTFKKVLQAGETTVYRVPSSYPEPPSGTVSAVNPQYFHFDSTAKLAKKAVLKFDETTIANEFNIASPNIQVFKFQNGGWVQLPHTIQGGDYIFTFPTKKLSGLIAFFSI